MTNSELNKSRHSLSANQAEIRVLGFAAFSGTGKTTLLKKVIPLLCEKGVRIAIIKHSHHDFEIDRPGKDSYELHHAGAMQTLISSKYRSALISENKTLEEPDLQQALSQLDASILDLVLVEGFRDETTISQIELHRPANGKPFLYPSRNNIIALASDETLECPVPLLDINNSQQIADFIIQWLNKNK